MDPIMLDTTSIADVLRRARKAAGVNISELARLASTSRAAVHAYEDGTRIPSVETAQRLLACTGHTLSVQPTQDVPNKTSL